MTWPHLARSPPRASGNEPTSQPPASYPAHSQDTTTATTPPPPTLPPPQPPPEPSPANKQPSARSQLRTVSPSRLLPVLCRSSDAGPTPSPTFPWNPATTQYKEIRSSTSEQASGNCASGSLSLSKTAAPIYSKWTTGNHPTRPHHLHHPWNHSTHISCDGGNQEL